MPSPGFEAANSDHDVLDPLLTPEVAEQHSARSFKLTGP
jgi:hypothetical protein